MSWRRATHLLNSLSILTSLSFSIQYDTVSLNKQINQIKNITPFHIWTVYKQTPDISSTHENGTFAKRSILSNRCFFFRNKIAPLQDSQSKRNKKKLSIKIIHKTWKCYRCHLRRAYNISYVFQASFVPFVRLYICSIRRKLIVRKLDDTFQNTRLKFAVKPVRFSAKWNPVRCFAIENYTVHRVHSLLSSHSLSLNSSLFYCCNYYCSCLLTCRQCGKIYANAKIFAPYISNDCI